MTTRAVTLPFGLLAASFLRAAERDWRGECYTAALEFYGDAIRVVGPDVVWLVHGTPVYRAQPEGPRIGHAWVEIELPGQPVMVFDLTVDPAPFDREHYYRDGCLRAPEAVVVRYDNAWLRRYYLDAKARGVENVEIGALDPRVAAAAHNGPDGRLAT